MNNIRLPLFIIIVLCLGAHKSVAKEYILYEFISVPETNKEEYLSLENFWSNIYKQQVEEEYLAHWELWQLIPTGSKQGAQYLKVSIFFDLSRALTYMYSPDLVNSARKAYPNKSEDELKSIIERYRILRSIDQQCLYEQIDRTKKLNFKMSIGSIAVLEFNKQLDENYELTESEQFKPFYQQMVNEEKIGHWGLMRAILPSGSNTFSTHVCFTFYDDLKQVADFMTNEDSMSEKSKLELEKGKNVRDMKEMVIAKLIMKN